MKLTLSIIAAVCLIPPIWLGKHALNVRRDRDLARVRLNGTLKDIAEIQSLRKQRPRAAARQKPTADIVGGIESALATAAVPIATMTSLSSDPESFVTMEGRTDARYLRQGVRLTLEPITLPAFGRFLNTWRQANPEWTVSSIQIGQATSNQLNSKTIPANSGINLPVRVFMTFETVYADSTNAATEPEQAGRS